MRTGVFVPAPEGNFIIDTPPELRLQLIREKVTTVNAVLYTHGHADHIFGLDDLRICGHRQNAPVQLYCEQNVEEQLRTSFNYAFAPPNPELHRFAIPRLEFSRIGEEPFEVLGQTVRPIRLVHGRLSVFGFRINDVAYCTDVSHIPDESWPLLEGLDALVLDALRDKPHPTHFGLAQSIAVAERVRPKRTYFTHISHLLEHHETNARLPKNIELAYDGLRIPF
jgi:phosphoribosyl 1,2-cyclic phosphate phosphodiesterase